MYSPGLCHKQEAMPFEMKTSRAIHPGKSQAIILLPAFNYICHGFGLVEKFVIFLNLLSAEYCS